MKYECGFYAVNKDHCWINGHCAVCRIDKQVQFVTIYVCDQYQNMELQHDIIRLNINANVSDVQKHLLNIKDNVGQAVRMQLSKTGSGFVKDNVKITI